MSSAIAPAHPAGSQTTPLTTVRKHTYGEILRSSALIGGSSIVDIAVSVIRAKAMALMLGPAGVGLLGLFSSIVDLAVSFAGMGINSSGVRQIAEAAGSGDTQRMARTAAVLRRTSVGLGVIGAVLLVALRQPVSTRTFGDAGFAAPVALLSLAVLFRIISEGQRALVQGMRRIGDLARIALITATLGTVATIGLIYFFRENGVVPSIVTVAAISLAVSVWYRRTIEIPQASLSAVQVRNEAAALLKLGSAFMASAVLTMGAAYAIRIVVRNNVGLDAAGLYQAAWTLGGIYVGFILQAMGSDFYPRLTAKASDDAECNRLVNEQAYVGLLLAVPGVIATLTCAPMVIAVFYASTFAGAVEPLRWICLGMGLRVIAWPMGFIVLAKGARGIFFWTEVAATIVHIGLAVILVGPFGLDGASSAFFGLYVWHAGLIYVIVRRLTGFSWSDANRQTLLLYIPAVAAVFCGFLWLPMWLATAAGIAATLATAIYSLRVMCTLVSLDRAPRVVQMFLVWTRMSSPAVVPPVVGT